MDAHLAFRQHYNQCMQKERATEALLQTLTQPHGVVSASVSAVLMACIQAVVRYGIKLWWDPQEGCRQDDLQLLLKRQTRSTLGTLPTTLSGTRMRYLGLTPVAVAIYASQQRFLCRQASACKGSKSKELSNYPTPGVLGGSIAVIEHTHGWRVETMCLSDPGEEPAVDTRVLQDNDTARRAAEQGARRKECKAGSLTSTWQMDGSQMDDRTVGATAACLNGEG